MSQLRNMRGNMMEFLRGNLGGTWGALGAYIRIELFNFISNSQLSVVSLDHLLTTCLTT